MAVLSFHCEKPLVTSFVVIEVEIVGIFFMWSGTMKEVRNSRSRASFPCQCCGIEPDSRSVAMGVSLVKDSCSWIGKRMLLESVVC